MIWARINFSNRNIQCTQNGGDVTIYEASCNLWNFYAVLRPHNLRNWSTVHRTNGPTMDVVLRYIWTINGKLSDRERGRQIEVEEGRSRARNESRPKYSIFNYMRIWVLIDAATSFATWTESTILLKILLKICRA